MLATGGDHSDREPGSSQNLRQDAVAARVDVAISIDSKERIRVDDGPVAQRR